MNPQGEKRTVLILGALDTHGPEIEYLRDRILAGGLNGRVRDMAVPDQPERFADGPARITANGCRDLLHRLCGEGRIHGVIFFGGGADGTAAAAAMQVLPPGFPKMILTPLASGVRPFGPFVGIRDMMVMHSLVDGGGVHDITRTLLDNAGAAIVEMAKNYRPMEIRGTKNVALTALGTVQKAINFICPPLIQAGYQPIIFHGSGVGGRIMEDFIERKTFCGVIELSLSELTDHLVGGFHDAGPDRLEAAGRMGIPQVIVPGCIDFFGWGPMETIPEKWRDRKKYYHNPIYTLIRPSHEEMKQVAETMVWKLNGAQGPVRVILPLRGMSIGGLKGNSSHDPEGDRIFFETLKKGLHAKIPVYELDCHVNEEPLAIKVVEEFLRSMERARG